MGKGITLVSLDPIFCELKLYHDFCQLLVSRPLPQILEDLAKFAHGDDSRVVFVDAAEDLLEARESRVGYFGCNFRVVEQDRVVSG